MCPRSQTSGLISVEWTRSRSSSEIEATSAQRPLARLGQVIDGVGRSELRSRAAVRLLIIGIVPCPMCREIETAVITGHESRLTAIRYTSAPTRSGGTASRVRSSSQRSSQVDAARRARGRSRSSVRVPPPASFGASVRNSSSTTRSLQQRAEQRRAALAQQRAGRRSRSAAGAARSSSSAHPGRAERPRPGPRIG